MFTQTLYSTHKCTVHYCSTSQYHPFYYSEIILWIIQTFLISDFIDLTTKFKFCKTTQVGVIKTHFLPVIKTYLKADSQVYSDIQWEWCTYTEQNYWAPTCVHCIILTCYMGRSSITGTLHCWDKHTWSQLNIWTANLLMSRHWYQRWTVSHVWPLTGREYTEKWDRLTATSSKLSLIISSV